MITFEKQKVIKPTERNSGASEYTLYRGEATDTKPIVAQPGDVFEEYDTGKVYVCSRDAKNRTKWTEDASAKRQTESGQTGLPSVTSTDNGKVLTVSNGAWAAAVASGGGTQMLVTLTDVEGTMTADKTFGEIHTASMNGTHVVIKLGDGTDENTAVVLSTTKFTENNTTVYQVYYYSGEISRSEGGENDYLTIA